MNAAAADMQARWTPTPEQIAAAENALYQSFGPEAVWTVHVLVGKTWGVWTEDVQVITADNAERVQLHYDRNAAYDAAEKMAELATTTTGKPCVGGVTRHSLAAPDLMAAAGVRSIWAVWDVI